MSEQVYQRVRGLLIAAEIPFVVMDHAATRTSAESARVRGESQDIGGKSLLIKVRDTFRIFVLPASRKLDNRALKEHFGTTYTRFATPEELDKKTGLIPGAVPPFGEPVLPFPLHLDATIPTQSRIAFNAGLRTRSVLMSVEDYLELAQPSEIFPFAGDRV